jgi:3'-phosphoadenosine 5'-phosphosulfate sulfotransferase (PAPS reductase)/FAD synthetase
MTGKQQQPSWARLEPERDTDGLVYGHRLVITFDSDSPDWSVESNGGAAVTFSLHLARHMAEQLPGLLAESGRIGVDGKHHAPTIRWVDAMCERVKRSGKSDEEVAEYREALIARHGR